MSLQLAPMSPQIVVRSNPSAVTAYAAEQLVKLAAESIEAGGRFTLALAGGSTPLALYALLASDEWRPRFDWSRVHVFFGDERAVPPQDDRSNYRAARLALLDHVPIPHLQVHRWLTEAADWQISAREYAAQVGAAGGSLDLVLLGLGPDGHTASLFPHSPQLEAGEEWGVATPVAPIDPKVARLTLTFPAINAARNVWFLVTGAEKKSRVLAALTEPRDTASRPSQGVEPVAGSLSWILDEDAASELPARFC